MGSVYKVRNTITDRVEAMKVMSPSLHSAPDHGERFSREIKIHASLEHPNIAALRTAIRVDNQLLMVMELVEGVTLERRLRSLPIDVGQSVEWILQVLSALTYAHARGVIHRDIKPANIMISSTNQVKLTDFGVASIAMDRRLTQTGLVVGSLHYMSPEQIQAGEPDARSDIYSLGVTFYEMLGRRRPFDGSSEYQVMKAHLEQIPPPLTSLDSNVPLAVAATVARAMAKRPGDRFQTAAEWKSALESVSFSLKTIQRAGVEVGQPSNMPPPPMGRPDLGSPDMANAGPTGPQTPGTGTLDPTRIDRVRKELAAYVGPLAGVLVARAAKKASDLRQLYDLLATEISTARDREAFLARRPR